MISDILVSQSTRPTHEVVIPTTMIDILQFIKEDKSNYPGYFNQKTYIINNSVCISFTGDWVIIKKALEDVKIFCRIYGRVTGEQLGMFLADRTLEGKWKAFGCIAYVIDEDGILTRFHYQEKEGISSIVGGVVAGGSGYIFFERLVS